MGALIVGALVGCNQQSIPEDPTIAFDRESLGFGAEFCSGTKINTEALNSLKVSNEGQNNLVINTIELTGPSVFRIETGTLPLTVKGLKDTFVAVYFKPTAKQFYDGKLTVTSNDPKTPVKEIKITGRGCQDNDCPPFNPPVPQCTTTP